MILSLRDELRKDRIKKLEGIEELAELTSDIWIRKVALRNLISITKTIFPTLPSANGAEEADEPAAELPAENVEELLEAFEKVVLMGVVWGPRPADLPDSEYWGEAEEPCLEADDLVGVKATWLVAIATAVLEFSGMNQEAGQLASHFPDETGEAGGDRPASAVYSLRDSTLGFPEGRTS